MMRVWAPAVSRFDRGLREEGVTHHGQPLGRVPVRRDDGAGLAVAFDDQLIEVVGSARSVLLRPGGWRGWVLTSCPPPGPVSCTA